MRLLRRLPVQIKKHWASAPLVILLVLAMMLSAGAGSAWSYTTGPASGTGTAQLATLQPATGVAVPATSTGTVTVQWTAAAGTLAPTGYYVIRIRTSDGATAAACGTSPSTPVTGTACNDAGVPDGSYQYRVTSVYRSWTAASSASNTVTVSAPILPGLPAKLEFVTQPSNSSTGVVLSTQPVVVLRDTNGNIYTGSEQVRVALTVSKGTLTGCASVLTVSGIATFSACTVTGAGADNYVLTAQALNILGLPNLLIGSATSAQFTVAGPAAKLAFTASPSNSSGGTAFANQPVIAVQDTNGRTTTAGAPGVTLSITGGPTGVSLACTQNPLTPSEALVAFAGCRIDKAGTYTLTATAAGLTSAASLTFTVAVGPAANLAFSVQPSGSTGGTAFSTQPVLEIRDAGGNRTASTAAVALSLTNPAGATLACAANPVKAVAGTAAFSGCSINKAGTYTFTASSGSLAPAISISFTITVGPAAKLAFTTSPSNSLKTVAFSVQPVVTIQDAGGNTVGASSAVVALAVTGTHGGRLTCSNMSQSGQITVSAQSGVATFTGCSINREGTYTLTATSTGFPAAISNQFIIS